MSDENIVEETKTEEVQFNKSEYLEGRQVKAEETAVKHGWVDLDSYMDNGGDPDNWISADRFNDKGLAIKSSQKQKANHRQELNEKLKGVNEVHKVHVEQMDIKISELTEKRDEAIEDGEVDKVAKLDVAIDKTKQGKAKLEASNQAVAQVAPEDIQHEQQWGQENQWLSESTPKGAYAREVANAALSSGYHGVDLTDHIEAEVLKAFPLKNPKRDNPGMSEKGGKKSQSKEALTMDSLTGEEKKIAESMINRGKSEKDVLAMVKDSRV